MNDSTGSAPSISLGKGKAKQERGIPFSKEEVEGSVPERFARVVNAFPKQTAVKVGTHILTYEALDRASNRVAQAVLAQLGQGAEPVALLLEHGAAPLVTLLGVLKAGKIYVPLYSSHSLPKLVSILEDLQPDLILTDSRNLPLATELAENRCQLINIDEIGECFSDEKIRLPISPDELSAILYTSGSTGEPKGVKQNHRNLLYAGWRIARSSQVTPEDHCSLLFFFGFGASLADIFSTLLIGATLYPYNAQASGPDQLSEWLIQEEITLLGLPANLFRQLTDQLSGDENFPKLRLVCPVGQTLYSQDVDRFRAHFPAHCILCNKLGTTEAGSVARFFIDRQTHIEDGILPVGYPPEDAEVFLLDDTGKKVGLDCAGEIAVRSRYLSLGYWWKPDLTQKVFLPDPEGGDRRIYLTGDRGIMRPDGLLEFLGRGDFRVKVRGYRVELKEIEDVLGRHPAVQETAVIALANGFDDNRLAAYVVSRQGQMPTVTELRRFVKENLPDYMIPSDFVMLEKMLLTPGGKLDRQALPAPDGTRAKQEKTFLAPRDDLELQLAKIWEGVLGIRPIGIKDDFYELGGHSLLAMRLFGRIHKVLGKNLPLTTLIQAPTIEKMSEILHQEDWSSLWSSLVPIRPAGSKPPFFCVHACGGEVIMYRNLANHMDTDQPLYGLRALGLDGKQNPHTRVEDMATHYIQEIKTVQPTGTYFLGGAGIGGRIAFEMAQQLLAQDEEVGLVVLIESAPPRTSPRSSESSGSRKSLMHYTGRSIHHLKRGQLARILRDITRAFLLKCFRRMDLMFRPEAYKNIRRIGDMLDKVTSSYIAQAYSGKVVYLLAETPVKSQRNLQDRVGAWRDLALRGLDVQVVPGTHRTIWKEPHVQVVAKQLSAWLADAQKETPLLPS